ncbi:hypothetical protein O181_095587, partial [Austropuccinia psidii MF-1]|nr:hypothetical protein [Austropuccinia psidii MF-1]
KPYRTKPALQSLHIIQEPTDQWPRVTILHNPRNSSGEDKDTRAKTRPPSTKGRESHVMNNQYHQEEVKPDAMLVNKARSPSQYRDGDNMSYSEKEALKQLPEASSWPKFSGTGEYDHMKLIDYIDGLFMDLPSIPNY